MKPMACSREQVSWAWGNATEAAKYFQRSPVQESHCPSFRGDVTHQLVTKSKSLSTSHCHVDKVSELSPLMLKAFVMASPCSKGQHVREEGSHVRQSRGARLDSSVIQSRTCIMRHLEHGMRH